MDRGRLACLMHSVPDSLMTTYSDVTSELQKLKPLVGTFFITSQATALYTSLGDHWEHVGIVLVSTFRAPLSCFETGFCGSIEGLLEPVILLLAFLPR
ncbi:hypothetical protein EYC80_005812 [Monilinia laxa]|nr:hypothetical protein EYC80_005812 [Monilinia laxa]